MRNATMGTATNVSMPWHGWILGGLLLLYGLAAAFDHGMSVAQGEAWYRASGMSDMQVGYFSAQPAWAIAGWTLSVWGGLLGALAMLLRRRLAGMLFALATAGGLVHIAYLLVLTDGREAMGVLWAMPLVLTALMALMVPYSRYLARRRAWR
jgi:hypothetical protein